MDPDEQLCAALLRNAEINPRIPISKLNEYKARCEKYGYDKQFDAIINSRALVPRVTTNKPLLPTNKPLLPTNKPLLPTNKPLLPTNKPLLPSNTQISETTNKILLPQPKSPRNNVLLQQPRSPKSNTLSLALNKELSTINELEISQLPIKLPEPLWNWKVEENEPPIPIKYPVRFQFNILLIEEWRRTIAELSLIDYNLDDFNVSDLRKLFDLYNLHFFNNSLPETNLDISNRLTVTAGTCAISRTAEKCVYSITMSRSLFTKLKLENDQVTKSGGLTCKSRLSCLQLVLEHEIIHLIVGHYYPNAKRLDEKIYSGHGSLFKNLVKSYFGQTESTHQIGNIIYDGSDKERTLFKDEIKIGEITSIIDKKGIKKGVIVNIYNKNVGIEFLDGDSWKVGAEFLHKISEEDDDYGLLLDLKKELSIKLNMYNNIKIGDTVQFYSKTKDDIITGRVVKLNTKSSKLSVQVGTATYTIVYSKLVKILKTTNTVKDKTAGNYTKSDFRVGDQVIIAGGPRSSPTYGSIIKLDRVNAQIKDRGSETIWRAPYAILSFQ